VLGRTGLSVAQHQARTVRSFLDLRDCAPDLPVMPVLQGVSEDEYLHCADLYNQHGVDLAACPVVCLGSVAHRQASGTVAAVIKRLWQDGIQLHPMGFKVTALPALSQMLASSDSMAWSHDARFSRVQPAGCTHTNCANCLRYALQWRSQLLGRIHGRAVTGISRDKET
jgi:hypothetical protein